MAAGLVALVGPLTWRRAVVAAFVAVALWAALERPMTDVIVASGEHEAESSSVGAGRALVRSIIAAVLVVYALAAAAMVTLLDSWLRGAATRGGDDDPPAAA